MRGHKLPHFMGGSIGTGMEICETSGLPIPVVPRFHKRNVSIKRKLRVWRTKKFIALKAPPSCACLQTTPFHGWQYRAENGNMRNFGPTNPHGTAFPQDECLYQIEATGMESPKMYCSSSYQMEAMCMGKSKRYCPNRC